MTGNLLGPIAPMVFDHGMRSLAIFTATCTLALAVGCDAKKSAPAAPSTPAAQVAQPASQPAGGAAAQPSSQPAGQGDTPATGNPHAEFDKTPPGTPFTGLVKLAEGLSEADLKPTDVLFIMARESQGGGLAGRLVAVQRLGAATYPMRYEVSAKDVMVPGIPFHGPFIVTARLDRDGDPMTRGEDDLYATMPTPVMAGQEGVHLVLKKGAPKTIPAPEGVKAPMVAPGQPSNRPAQPSSQPAR